MWHLNFQECIDGFADHLVSESLYLRDPENNGIEIYRDRPAREWLTQSTGNVMMDTLPLDLQSLLSEVNEEETKNPQAFPSGARIGHMHIKVTNLERPVLLILIFTTSIMFSECRRKPANDEDVG
jgi:catechol 2,3-dioxygenase